MDSYITLFVTMMYVCVCVCVCVCVRLVLIKAGLSDNVAPYARPSCFLVLA